MALKNFLFLPLFLICILPKTMAQKTKPAHYTLIKDVHIFNGMDKNLTHGNILVKGNKIAKISENSIQSRSKDSVKIIDGKGQYLIPGLIDAHTHITFEDLDIPLSKIATEADWATLNIIATQAAKRQLLRGFTTIRNMGGNAIPLSKAIDNGIIPGPRIYPSGAFISQSGGHGDFGLLTDVPRSSDEFSYLENVGFTAVADGADQVLRRTREQLRQGATQIKLMAGGGVSSNYDPIDVSQFTVDEFKAAVSAAESYDTYVGVHAYTPRAIQTAIKGGVKTIEHGHLMDEETAQLMADKGIWLSIQPFLIKGENPYPEGSANAKKLERVVEGTDNAYKLAKTYDLKTAWGTDLFGGKAKADKEGSRLADLKRWYKPYEILKMATSTNAEMLRMSGKRDPYQNAKLGEISEGAYADLIIVNENPLDDIDLVKNPKENFSLIMKGGVVYKNKND